MSRPVSEGTTSDTPQTEKPGALHGERAADKIGEKRNEKQFDTSGG